MPTCPKCGKWISESHYGRHLGRCGVPSAKTQVESPEGITYGPPSIERGGINWRKVGAAFLIFLLIGSVVVFFVLYALSLL